MQGLTDTQLSAMKLRAFLQAPYLAPLLNRMVYDRGLEDMIANKGAYGVSTPNGFYAINTDEKTVDCDNTLQLAEILIHESMHIFRDHAVRLNQMNAEQKKALIASDLEIEPAVNAITKHPSLCKGGVTASMFPQLHITSDDSMEQIYQKLEQLEPQENPESDKPSNYGLDNGNDSQEDGEPRPGDDKESTQQAQGCGFTPTNPEDIDPAQQASLEEAIRETALEISRSNDAPYQIKKIAYEILNGKKINWKSVIRKALRTNINAAQGHRKTTYKRLPRRKIDPFILPGSQKKKSKVLIALDTSGSMTFNDALNLCLGEIWNCCKYAEVQGFGVTTEAQAISKIKSKSDLQKLTTESGGTDMCEAFKAAEENGQALILLTDGETPYPKKDDSFAKIKHQVFVFNTYDDSPDWINSTLINTEEE